MFFPVRAPVFLCWSQVLNFVNELIFLSWVQSLHNCQVQIPYGYHHWRFELFASDSFFFFFNQLDAQTLYLKTFIMFLYMFWAVLCSSSGGQIVLVQHLVSSLSLGDCSVHRLQEDSRNLCTEQSPKESDDTRCCNNTICPPEDEDNSAWNV